MQIPQALQHIQHTVTAWDAIAAHPHRFGGVEFRVGAVEIGHFHRSGMVDIPFTRKIRAALVAQGLAEPHHLLADSGWISFYLGRTGDAEAAIALFRLSYLQKRRRRVGGLEDEIAQLPLPPTVLSAAFGESSAPQ
jgi:hypothetical protein